MASFSLPAVMALQQSRERVGVGRRGEQGPV